MQSSIFSAQCGSPDSDNDDNIVNFFKDTFSELHPGAQFGWDKFESRIKQHGEFGKVTRVLKVLPKARNKEVVFEFLIDVTKNLDKKIVIGYIVKSTKILLKDC